MTKSNVAVLDEWGKITIWCLNHDNPVEMHVTQNTENIKTPFYACTENGACANRLNLDDYQGIVLQFLEMMAEDPISSLLNRSFYYKGARHKIFIRVIKYDSDDIRLGVKNCSILV